MDSQDLIARAKLANVTELVAARVKLRKASSHEWEGPCPKCGGADRLHATADWWFCRQCHTKRGDAIDWLRFADGLSFPAAVERLTGERLPDRNAQRQQPQPKTEPAQSPDWLPEAQRELENAQAALWSDDDTRGAEYLADRGLMGLTWQAFGLGYGFAMNRDTGAEQPAIAMPWYRGSRLTAIRWRFLAPSGKQKITSRPGSRFGGQLFGGQAMPSWVRLPVPPDTKPCEALCTLVLCEGEINAMSIWQVAYDTRVHVLSLGSESAHLPDGAVKLASRYGRVIIWMDKPELAKRLMAQVPGAFGIASPGGRDANDLLQAGHLLDLLSDVRRQACRTDEERRVLEWTIEGEL